MSLSTLSLLLTFMVNKKIYRQPYGLVYLLSGAGLVLLPGHVMSQHKIKRPHLFIKLLQ